MEINQLCWSFKIWINNEQPGPGLGSRRPCLLVMHANNAVSILWSAYGRDSEKLTYYYGARRRYLSYTKRNYKNYAQTMEIVYLQGSRELLLSLNITYDNIMNYYTQFTGMVSFHLSQEYFYRKFERKAFRTF